MSVTIYVSHGGQPRAHLASAEGALDAWRFLGAELARAAEEELDHLDIRIRGVMPRPPSPVDLRAVLDDVDADFEEAAPPVAPTRKRGRKASAAPSAEG